MEQLPWPWNWFALTTLLAALGYVYLTWTHGYWRRRGVPYDEPNLMGGAFKDAVLLRRTVGEVYRDIYRRMAGHPFCGYFKCRQPALLVRDPDLIRAILVRDFHSFRDNDFHQDPGVDPMFGRSPFSVKGDRWRAVRAQLTPTFTAARMRALGPQLEQAGRELREFLERATATDPPGGVDTKEMAAMFATDAVALCMLGIHGNSLKDRQGEFGRIGSFLLETSVLGTAQVLSILLTPRLAHWLRLRFIPEGVASFFLRVVREATDQRIHSGSDVKDYLQLSIALRCRGEGFTDEDAAAHAAMFYMDGFEPTSTVLSLALWELARQPAVQERARAEVDAVLGRHQGALSLDVLQELRFLDMVVAETLRKYPPLRSLDRLCTQPYDLPLPSGDTCCIEPGTPVIIPVYALHMDPEYYPEPERFNPERFTEESKQTQNKYTYLPFGDGPRVCLGSRYALAVIKMGVATALRDYRVLPCRQTPAAITQDVLSAFYLAARESVRLRFERRSLDNPTITMTNTLYH